MTPAVIYARYSSAGQTEQSIEGQLRVCKEFAEREGYQIIGEYIDRAITGRMDDRPQFQKMLRDSAKHQFEYVIVYKLDRFARNRRDSANNKYRLRMNGVRVVSAMEQIGESPESIILEAVLEAQAEYYSIDLSQKVRRGQRETVAKGKFLGGYTPYGYRIVEQKAQINEDEATHIRYLFSEYAAGKPKKQIIQELNNGGVRSPRTGKPLTLTTFQYVLSSTKYIGKYEFQGKIYDDIYPAIVDEKTFYKAQERLKLNKNFRGQNKATEKYYLTGKAFCGHCGGRMVGIAGTSRSGERHHYYACAERYKKKTCDKTAERKSFLESYVVEQACEYVLRPKRADFIAKKVVAEYDKEFNDNKTKELEIKIARIEREIFKISKDYLSASAPIQRALNEKSLQLDAQLQELQVELAKMRISVSQRLTVDEVKAWLRIFTNGDPADPNFRERIIDIFINAVYVYDGFFVIYYNIKDGKQVCYVDHISDLDKLRIPHARGSYIKQSGLPNSLKYEHDNVIYIFEQGRFGILIKR